MANAAVAFGFRPVKHLSGSPWNGQAQVFYLPSGDGNNTFMGDIVKLAGGACDAVHGVPPVTIAGATDTPLGAVVGFDVSEGLTPNLNIAYRPASTAMYVWVVTDPMVVYEAEMSGSLANTKLANLTKLTQGGGGSTTNNFSSFALDSTQLGTTNTLPFKILRLANRPNNSVGTNAVVECIANIHAYAYSTAGV